VNRCGCGLLPRRRPPAAPRHHHVPVYRAGPAGRSRPAVPSACGVPKLHHGFDLQRRGPALSACGPPEERHGDHRFIVGTRQGHERHGTSGPDGSSCRQATAPPPGYRGHSTGAHPSSAASPRSGACAPASARGGHQQRSRNVSVTRAELRQRSRRETRPLHAAARNTIHRGLDLYSGVFAPCSLGCPGTTRYMPSADGILPRRVTVILPAC
jgi:hypothetical protein